MKKFKWLVGAALAAALVAGCGGGDGGVAAENKRGFSNLVSFGDSLSDAGTYAVGTVAALGGGRYTVNTGTTPFARIWVDLISAQLSLPAPCAAVKGLDGLAAQGFSVPATNQAACTNYAQGGSRVTNPIGPGNKNIPSSAALGQLTYPVSTQIADHLGRNAGAFDPKSLVTVMAGGNDVFMQGAVASAAAAIDPSSPATITNFQTVATVFGGWTGAQVNAVLTGGGQTAVQNGLLANMGKAGTELAALVNTQIIGKGAKNVVVVNLPNVGATPNGVEGGPQVAALSTAMAQAFNQALAAGLAGSGAIVVDAYTTSTDQFNNPSAYGLSNVTARSCKKDSSNALGGTALVCNSTNVVAGDISRYGFADDVHPSVYGHQLLAQLVAKYMAVAGLL
jgi:outer membrane lipase/esterase